MEPWCNWFKSRCPSLLRITAALGTMFHLCAQELMPLEPRHQARAVLRPYLECPMSNVKCQMHFWVASEPVPSLENVHSSYRPASFRFCDDQLSRAARRCHVLLWVYRLPGVVTSSYEKYKTSLFLLHSPCGATTCLKLSLGLTDIWSPFYFTCENKCKLHDWEHSMPQVSVRSALSLGLIAASQS